MVMLLAASGDAKRHEAIKAAVSEATAGLYAKDEVDAAIEAGRSAAAAESSAALSAAMGRAYDGLAVGKARGARRVLRASRRTGALAKARSFSLRRITSRTGRAVTYGKAGKAGGRLIRLSSAGKVTARRGLARGEYRFRVRASCGGFRKCVFVRVIVR